MSVRSSVSCVALLASSLLAARTARAQTEEELSLRRVALERAQALSSSGDHAQALQLATRAGAIQMTPSVRLFIAREQAAVGQHAAALLTAQTCQREVARAEVSNRAEILTACRDVAAHETPLVGMLQIEPPATALPGLEVRVRDAVVGASLLGLPYVVDPGSVVVVATAPGHVRFEATVTLAAQETRTVRLDLPRTEAPAGAVAAVTPEPQVVPPVAPPRAATSAGAGPGPYVLMGVGGALVVGGAISLGLLVARTQGCTVGSDAEGPVWDCADARSDEERMRDLGAAPTLQGVGGSLVGVGLGAVAAGVIWRVVAPSASRRDERVEVAPAATATSAGLRVGGRF